MADDASLTMISKPLKDINWKVNYDLKRITDWLRANRISLNANKTEIIIFRAKQKTFNKRLNFPLSGKKINLCHSVRYLGLITDEHLTWNEHMSFLKSKLPRANWHASQITSLN